MVEGIVAVERVIEEEIVVEELTVDVADVNNEACQSTETHPTECQPLRPAILIKTSGICNPPYGIGRTNQGLSYTV